ncbi:alpha/beta hydrolase family protein [Mangrovitalea sediminis]|uniref:alpha/beta hydrolase family protein n=1 Tax=Mangrovitalea sediminis TaxID=1982043 RepID=UPI000BE58F98|nr:alpha/beta fold hydrolase [Mangrovitalea sediminis]
MTNHGQQQGLASLTTNTAVLSLAPIVVASPGRGLDMEIRVSVPLAGQDLPVIVFSHGNGQSLYAYGPLTNYWASQGFLVIQPTHLDSRTIGLAADDDRRPWLWQHRENDLLRVLDQLDLIEATVPTLKGRVDRGRIAVAGHSWGGHTASVLLGARHPNPEDGSMVSLKDPRVKAGILLAVAGRGEDLTPSAASRLPFLHPDYSEMTSPALIIAGSADQSAMTTRGPDWWRDAFDLSPGRKALFTVLGGEHSLGGIPNYEARETTDESTDRVAAIRRLSTAYLRSALYPADDAWQRSLQEIEDQEDPQGVIETK